MERKAINKQYSNIDLKTKGSGHERLKNANGSQKQKNPIPQPQKQAKKENDVGADIVSIDFKQEIA